MPSVIRFSHSYLTFAKRYRAVIAHVNIRGGNEFGERWHEEGMKDKKACPRLQLGSREG